MSMMTAVSCVRPNVLELVQRPRPTRQDHEVLVRVRRIGICGNDYHIFAGQHPFLAYPRIMGHELAVEILEAPPGSLFRAGDTAVVNPYLSCGTCIACRNGKPNCCMNIAVLGVHIDGGMCEQMCLPAANLIKSDGLSLDECATVEFLAIGAHSVRRADLRRGERILIAGAGPIGIGVALFAHIAGARVVVMDRDPERLTMVEDVLENCETVLADDEAAAVIARMTSGEGFDAVFDATGNNLSIEKGFNFVAHGGRYILVSVVNHQISFSDPEFHKREMMVIGSRNATEQDFRHVIEGIKADNVPVARLVTHRTSLANVVTDLPLWAVQKHGLIKAMVEIE